MKWTVYAIAVIAVFSFLVIGLIGADTARELFQTLGLTFGTAALLGAAMIGGRR